MGIANRILSMFQGYNWLIIPAAFFAIVFHEISHGYVAFLLGDRTAKDSGRLSLNPISHIDVFGLICMVIFGFGWAKPVPVNPYYFKNRKLSMSLVAIAGPVSNLIMAAISLLCISLLTRLEISGNLIIKLATLLVYFFNISAILNVGLAVFNLIPIPPLDGSKILFALLPTRAYRFILTYERYGMLILFILINVPLFENILMYLRTLVFSGMFSLILGM